MQNFLNSHINSYPYGVKNSLPFKRKIFISYHHKNDQYWYDQFSSVFSDQLDLFFDNSLERKIDSDNAPYLDRKIREEYIKGTSITILLCGKETYKRRWADWETHSTLEYEHALLGVILPKGYHSVSNTDKILIPDRLFENIESGYAHWIYWPNDYKTLKQAIETAINLSHQKSLIRNSTEKMKRSLP